jgi:cardiolipin synthase A/B
MPTWLLVIAIISMVIVALLLFLILFEPGLEYRVRPLKAPLDSDEFVNALGALSDAQPHRYSRVQVLTDGDQFYEAELKAIREAKETINMEHYIFRPDEMGRKYVEALTERARAGVKVKVVLDWIGSFTTRDRFFAPLREAGGRLTWYQPLRWYTFKRFNNRTHRNLLIVDGRVGFVGGAGVADWWMKDTPNQPKWRDTAFRVEGEAVVGLQSTFADNWLEGSGGVLAGGADYFPGCRGETRNENDRGRAALVVNSDPSIGRGSRARILFQVLLAQAKESIDITTPYFLPDGSGRREMARAIKERGVKVRILVPGKHSDHIMTRRASRRRFGELLAAGAEIYEYEPAMIHSKVMVIDKLWNVVGTTNFDNRSFGINDEVNLAVIDRELAARLNEDFCRDVSQSHRVTAEEWNKRPLTERAVEWASWILERQS